MDKKMKWFLSYLWINVDNINSEVRYKKIILFLIQFKNERPAEMYRLSDVTFMIVLIPCINLLNLSWTIKCIFLRAIALLNRVTNAKITLIEYADEEGLAKIVLTLDSN